MNRWRARLAELQSNTFAPADLFKMFKLFKNRPPFSLLNILNKSNTRPSRCRPRKTAPGTTPTKNAPPLPSTTAVRHAYGLKH